MHAMNTLTFIACVIILYYMIMRKTYYHLKADAGVHYIESWLCVCDSSPP